MQGITIYPPTRGLKTQGDPFEPVKIGILIDMDLNQLLADWIDPTILAIEDALNEGVWARSPVQLVIADARGLPRENYRKVIDGYRWLVEQGCVVVLGPMISDNSLVLQDTANELGVACIGWTGAHKFASEYCFTVANGDIPTEGDHVRPVAEGPGARAGGPVLGGRLVGQGLRRLLPRHRHPAGADHHPRGEARAQPASACRTTWPPCASSAPRASTTAATATPRSTSPTRSRRSTGTRPGSWAPPSCSIRTPTSGPRASRAGTASTSSGEDGANPNYNAMIARFEQRFGRKTANVVVALAYDTARVAIHGIANAAIPAPRHVKEGMEKIRWMPATNGGPGCYIQFGPWDRKGYKGDFLTIRELRGGELRFDGYHRPAVAQQRRRLRPGS